MSDNKVSTLSLKTLLVPSKDVEVEYPGMPGFSVKLSFLSRDTLIKLRKQSTTQKRVKGELVEEVNDELFLELYAKAIIKGWKGFKLKYVSLLAPVDLSGQDMESELAYTEENALFLMKNSSEFDSWVGSQVSDLSNFQTTKSST